ncbi:MAG: RidA family protein [Anaerolineae bacterium]|jgi:2-iminobutanoate/2-iminopropanoate deaminase|nr:RidA family protein [Anaerolineae bacterium]
MKQIIHTDQAPPAAGPYSQAVVANGFVFTAGQLGLDPATGQFVPGGVTEQTHQALKNLRAVLEASGTNLDHAVKAVVFLKDMNDFAAMNTVYAQYLGGNSPARSTVQVAKLPLDGLVEIELVALIP